jgi:carbon-monoxide dehydrogenase small subunit
MTAPRPDEAPIDRHRVGLVVNGRHHSLNIEARMVLADLLRDALGLTGTHLGCETGECGSCTVILDGATARSCTVLAVKADGCQITTIEGVARDGALHPVQEAFIRHHAIQCGFCTPGMIMTAIGIFDWKEPLDECEVRRSIAGNLCRCTGYEPIVRAILEVAGASGTSDG